MTRSLRRIALSLGFATAVVAGFGNAPPAHAMSSATAANCGRRYIDCVDRASQLDTFWKRGVEGIACFLDFLACGLRDQNP